MGGCSKKSIILNVAPSTHSIFIQSIHAAGANGWILGDVLSDSPQAQKSNFYK
jgi:hypothetical protein